MRKEKQNMELSTDRVHVSDVISRLTLKVNKIAKEADADVDRVLFAITGNYIEIYELDEEEENVKRFLGSYSLNDL